MKYKEFSRLVNLKTLSKNHGLKKKLWLNICKYSMTMKILENTGEELLRKRESLNSLLDKSSKGRVPTQKCVQYYINSKMKVLKCLRMLVPFLILALNILYISK